MTSGPASPKGGTNLQLLRTPWGERQFYSKDDRFFQRSMVEQGKEWEVVQVKDSVTPGNPNYNEKARFAKTIQKHGTTCGRRHIRSIAHANSPTTSHRRP